MIKEAYVSFEIAKLLKEKEFDEDCYTFYEYNNKEFYREERIPCCNSRSDDYAAPTHQMAIAWLREVYGLYIWVDYSRLDCNEKQPYLWNIVETKVDGDYWGGTYNKYAKNAVEAALKYCLENLI